MAKAKLSHSTQGEICFGIPFVFEFFLASQISRENATYTDFTLESKMKTSVLRPQFLTTRRLPPNLHFRLYRLRSVADNQWVSSEHFHESLRLTDHCIRLTTAPIVTLRSLHSFGLRRSDSYRNYEEAKLNYNKQQSLMLPALFSTVPRSTPVAAHESVAGRAAP